MAEMAPGAAGIDALKAGGFRDDEIQDWAATRRAVLSDGGFSNAEIGEYFGKPEPDKEPIQSFFSDMAAANIAETTETDQEATRLNMVEAFQAGFQQSVTGLAVRGELPDKELSEHAPAVNRIASQTGTLMGDFPFMVAGAVATGADAFVEGVFGPDV